MGFKPTLASTSAMLLLLAILSGCTDFGQVEQGRVVVYDQKRHIVTLIKDRRGDARHPDYSVMPPVSFQMPTDPAEIGAEPKAGLLIDLDLKANVLHLYNEDEGGVETIPYTPVSSDRVRKRDPRVFNRENNAAREFPILDREKNTITFYLKSEQLLVTVSIPEQFFHRPEHTWRLGDEVRIYYKEAGKARRFMNITRTDIYKK